MRKPAREAVVGGARACRKGRRVAGGRTAAAAIAPVEETREDSERGRDGQERDRKEMAGARWRFSLATGLIGQSPEMASTGPGDWLRRVSRMALKVAIEFANYEGIRRHEPSSNAVAGTRRFSWLSETARKTAEGADSRPGPGGGKQ